MINHESLLDRHANTRESERQVIDRIEADYVSLFQKAAYNLLADAEQADQQLASLSSDGGYRLTSDIRQSVSELINQVMFKRNGELTESGFVPHVLSDEANLNFEKALEDSIDVALQQALLASFVNRAEENNFSDNSLLNMQRFPVQSQDLVGKAIVGWLKKIDDVCRQPNLFHQIDPYAEVFWNLGSKYNDDKDFGDNVYGFKSKSLKNCRMAAQSQGLARVVDNIESVFTYVHSESDLASFRGALPIKRSTAPTDVHLEKPRLHVSSNPKAIVTATGAAAAVLAGVGAAPAAAYAADNAANINLPGAEGVTVFQLPNFSISSDTGTASKGLVDSKGSGLLEVPAATLPSDKSLVATIEKEVPSLDVPSEIVPSDKSIDNNPKLVKHAPEKSRGGIEVVASAAGPEQAAKEIIKNTTKVAPPIKEYNPILDRQLQADAEKYQAGMLALNEERLEYNSGDVVLARFLAALDNPASLADINDEEYAELMNAYGADFGPLMKDKQQSMIDGYNNVKFGKWKGVDADNRSKLAAMMAYLEFTIAADSEIQNLLEELAISRAEAASEAKAAQELENQEAKKDKSKPNVFSRKQIAKESREVYEDTIRKRIHDLTEQVRSVPGTMYDPIDPDWLTDEILKADKAYPHDELITPEFVIAQLYQESKFDPNVGSHKGALGIAQFMSGTADEYGLSDRTDPTESIKAYYKMMDKMVKNAKADYPNQDPLKIALASYNAGPGAVAQYGGIPNYTETINYVDNIGKITDKTERWVDDASNKHIKQVADRQAEQARKDQADKKRQADKKAEQKKSNPPKHRNGTDQPPKNPTECAPGTYSVGFVESPRTDGKQEVCAVSGLSSTSEESTPGKAHYVDGAKGNGLIQAKYSQALVDMVAAAKKDGYTISLSSSWRTNKHQHELWEQNGRNPVVVAPPAGTTRPDGSIAKGSNHEAAAAIDIYTGTPISTANCEYVESRCVQTKDPLWVWLDKNAHKFGFYQYSAEWWHWGPNEVR